MAFELIRAAEPSRPVLEELRRRGNEKSRSYHRRQLCCIPDTEYETIHSKAIASRLKLNLTVLCTMASYAAADCHFQQDAHRRITSEIARIRRAEERKRGERAQDQQSVNGEKLSCH